MSSAKQEQGGPDKNRDEKPAKPKSHAGVPTRRKEDEGTRPDLDRKQRGRNGR